MNGNFLTIKSSTFVFSVILFLQSFCSSYSQIAFKSDLLAGLQKEPMLFTTTSSCEELKLATNFKRVSITIEDLSNLEGLIITDVPLNVCNVQDKEGEMNKVCSEKSSVCQVTSGSTPIIFTSRMCLEFIYIYVRTTTKKNMNSSFKITTDYDYESCEFVNFNSFSYCGESPIEECRNCERAGCVSIDCGYEKNKEFIKVSELCIPFMTNPEDRLKRCKIFDNITTFKSETDCDQDFLKQVSLSTVFFVSVIIIVTIVFAGIIFYYNIYYMMKKEVPFEVPEYFPTFIFPRPELEIPCASRTSMSRIDEIIAKAQASRKNLRDVEIPSIFPKDNTISPAAATPAPPGDFSKDPLLSQKPPKKR